VRARPQTVGFQPLPSTCDSNRLVPKQDVHAVTRPDFGAFCLARANRRGRVRSRGVCIDGNTPSLQVRKRDGAARLHTALPAGQYLRRWCQTPRGRLGEDYSVRGRSDPLGQARKSLPPALLHPVPWLQRWVGKARTRAGALAHGQSNINARAPKKTVRAITRLYTRGDLFPIWPHAAEGLYTNAHIDRRKPDYILSL